MMPGKKGRLSPEVIDELMQFVDSQAASGESQTELGSEGLDNAPSVEVEIESKPPGGMPGGKVCPTCGHAM